MHCEGDKIYTKSDDCTICGMDLVEQPKIVQNVEYTCPMHPEIVNYIPASCPIYGIDLIPLKSSEREKDITYIKFYIKLLKK